MPTGYTAELHDGEQSFEEFVWRCARGIGYLVSMRDAPMDAPIPESFEVSTYHERAAAEAEARIAELEAMTDEQAEAAEYAAYRERRERERTHQAEKNALAVRYREMLRRVREWEPPTTEHEPLKALMVDQLEQSIEYDTHPVAVSVERMSGAEWRERELERARQSAARHREEQAEDEGRAARANAWLKALRESVPPPVAIS